MKYEETYNAYINKRESTKTGVLKKKPSPFLTSNDKDLFWHPDIPEDVKSKVRTNFGLNVDEEILFVRDTSFLNNRNQGVVITDCGVHYVPDNDGDINCYYTWDVIKNVEYKDNHLYFFGYNGREEHVQLHIGLFMKGVEMPDINSIKSVLGSGKTEALAIGGLLGYATSKVFPEDNNVIKQPAGTLFASLFTSMANTQKGESRQDIVNKYEKLLKEGKEDEALEILLERRKEGQTFLFTPQIAEFYFRKGQREKAFRILEEDINASETGSETAMLYYEKYLLHKENGESDDARRACVYVINHATNDDESYDGVHILDKAREDFKEIENDFVCNFLEAPHRKRKLIVPVDSYPDLLQKKVIVLDINHLPNINFPMGHPIANQLYVGHPYTPTRYILFDSYEVELLEDKLREYCQVMQYLGATEIKIESIQSKDSATELNKDKGVAVGANIEERSASCKYENNATNKLLEAISHSLQLHQKYIPHGKPKLPEKLVWYTHEPSWQRTFEQRMQGSLLEHEERIETKKSRVVDNSELTEIAADLKYLLYSVDSNLKKSIENKLTNNENIVLSIHVRFAPLESLQDNATANAPAQITQQSSLTKAETEYLEEVRSCLEEEGEITPRERRLLNRIREKSGITEERAAELEATLQAPQLTEEEKEYLDEYKACLEESEDGTLSPRERRLLDKIRASLDITEERAAELEKL